GGRRGGAGGRVGRPAAGLLVTAAAVVTNRAPEPRIIAVAPLGVDATWLPRPARSRVLMPGESIELELTLRPAIGTLPARYPLTVTAQGMSPTSGRATSHAALAVTTLVVDAPGQIEVEIVPEETSARVRKRITVWLRNVGSAQERVYLEAQSPEPAEVQLAE